MYGEVVSNQQDWSMGLLNFPHLPRLLPYQLPPERPHPGAQQALLVDFPDAVRAPVSVLSTQVAPLALPPPVRL